MRKAISCALCLMYVVSFLLLAKPGVAQEGDVSTPYAIASSRSGEVTGSQEIHCSCVSDDDRITVVRTEGSIPISAQLDQASDFEDALWLIDSGNTGKNQIAVMFHRVDGQLTADIYQDQDGNGDVDVSLRPGDVRVLESQWWSIRVTARDGYWQRDGRIAPNFDILVDEQFAATFGGQLYFDAMKHDGVVDVTTQVRGPTATDPRSYDWRTVSTPFPASSGIYRTTLTVREHGQEPAFAPSFPWYLLGPPAGLVKPNGESFAPIQVDWATGKLIYLGEFVASRGSDVNWFTYSVDRVDPGVVNNPNFESPFSFYDLANDQDSVPELEVRVDRANPGDSPPISTSSWGDRGYQLIRYSWDQRNDQNWTYKLGLLGDNPIESEVAFPDFTLKTIPYDDLPSWVTSHAWDVATFVAAERPLWTSEGIYDGDPGGAIRDAYYAGASNSDSGFGDTVGSGIRMETSLHLATQPWLSFSPIDRKLHLVGADRGVWNIDGLRELRYLRSDGADAFDGWQLWNSGALEAQLYRIPGGLLYSGPDGTYALQADVASELFRTLPPTNHDEWQALGQQLAANAGDLPPGDLRAMLDQFGGDPVLLAREPIVGFQRSDGGVSFSIDVRDPETITALSAATGVAITPGLQTVAFANGQWSATAAALAPPTISIAAQPDGALQAAPVLVTIDNPGALPLEDVTLRVQVVGSDGTVGVNLGQQAVTVAPGAQQVLPFTWAPGRGDDWTIRATLTSDLPDPRTGAQVVLLDQQEQVDVAPVVALAPRAAGRLGWSGTDLGRLATFVALIALTGSCAAIGLWKGIQR